MTLVHIKHKHPDGIGLTPSEGYLEWTPTRRRTEDDTVVLPEPFKTPLVEGVTSVEVAPTAPSWAWVVYERIVGGTNRCLVVPDALEVNYTDLVDVDPKTLSPVAMPEASWWAALDTAETGATAAATSAANSATAANQSKMDAGTSATSAGTSATNAAGSATGANQAKVEAEAARDATIAALPTKQDKTALDADVAAKASTPGTALATALSAAFVSRRTTDVLVSGSTDYVFIKDTSDATGSVLRMEDTEPHDGSILHIAHRGGVGTPGQAYGINLANYPGAKGGFIGHQYSKASPFMQIDNTDLNAAIYIRNTPNTTQNPGGQQIGDFFQFKPGSEVSNRLILKDNLTFWNQTSLDFKVQADNATNYAFGVQTSKDITGLSVTKSGTGTGDAVTITNAGTYPGLRIVQNGASNALLVDGARAALFGKAVARFLGNTHSAQFDINADGGSALLVNKTSAGNGDAIRIVNPGTGPSIDFRNTAAASVAKVNPNGEYENLTAGAGPIIKSPNGTRYRVTATDAGALALTAA